MNNLQKDECPHILLNNLITIEKFKLISFENLKCEKCDENKDILICLICGKFFCSKNVKNHFNDHYINNIDHCIYIEYKGLHIYCLKCIEKESENNRVYQYIQSQICEEYLNIIENCIYGDNNNDGNKTKYKIINQICNHIKEENIIDEIDPKIINNYIVKQNLNIFVGGEEKSQYFCICLICGEQFENIYEIEEHFELVNHILFINLSDWTLICAKCEIKIILKSLNDLKKYRIIFQILKEKKINIPKTLQGLKSEEIYELKYHKFIKYFTKGKFSKILFMVGAGISTSAGIPDFRSKTGLFKQLQDKYKLSSPEEFFMKDTFLKKPHYFYEFTKLFDLSKVKPTITHFFMNYLVNKNMVKYIFTQNIDGLEKKAKIPEEKIIYAHGNFFTGHCAQCYRQIDIEEINKGIKKGEIYYCPVCYGPCKPNIVFYGEKLSSKFYDTIKEIKENKDIDLIIIMGTSLKVMPFANIPNLLTSDTYKVLFNIEKVGNFNYEKLTDESVFIKGETDINIIKFLKDSNLYKDFEEFVKKEYNEELDNMMKNEQKTISIHDEDEVEQLIKEIKNNLNIDDYK